MSEMTNEQLAAIRERADNRLCNSPWHETCMRIDHAALLAEVDRLRAALEARDV